ncbi:MAG: response regulator [Thermoplasmatota archaeon]
MPDEGDHALAIPSNALHLRRFTPPPTGSIPPVRVLVMDTNRDVAQTLARTVERLPGVEAVVSHSIGEALEMVEEAQFDAALVDLGLDARGVDLLLAIRMASPETIRILLSAWPDESVAVGGAVFTGAQAWFQKPWNTGSLLDTLRKLLGPRQVRIARGAYMN